RTRPAPHTTGVRRPPASSRTQPMGHGRDSSRPGPGPASPGIGGRPRASAAGGSRARRAHRRDPSRIRRSAPRRRHAMNAERSERLTSGPAEAFAGLLDVAMPDVARSGVPLLWHWVYLLERLTPSDL